MEAIVLAGGLGTRLQKDLHGLPKVLAPIADQPFLFYILKDLEIQGITHCVLSLGYLAEQVEKALNNFTTKMKIECVIEKEKLGTGGGARFAAQACQDDSLFVINGDTFFPTPLSPLINQIEGRNISASLALAQVDDTSRYGRVEMAKSMIVSFQEKGFSGPGLINAGRYLIKRDFLLNLPEQKNLSLENDLLYPAASQNLISGVAFPEVDFIDIGIPEDYKRAANIILKS